MNEIAPSTRDRSGTGHSFRLRRWPYYPWARVLLGISLPAIFALFLAGQEEYDARAGIIAFAIGAPLCSAILVWAGRQVAAVIESDTLLVNWNVTPQLGRDGGYTKIPLDAITGLERSGHYVIVRYRAKELLSDDPGEETARIGLEDAAQFDRALHEELTRRDPGRFTGTTEGRREYRASVVRSRGAALVPMLIALLAAIAYAIYVFSR